jgi:hypothetical protein
MSENESTEPKRKRGGQPGNKNALKHGFYTDGGRKRLEEVDALIRDCRELLQNIERRKR